MVVCMEDHATRYGAVLKRAMEKHGDTQADAARKLGKSGPTVGTYIRGEIEMPYLVRELATRVYGVEPDDFDVEPADRGLESDMIALCVRVMRNRDLEQDTWDMAASVLERLTHAKKY